MPPVIYRYVESHRQDFLALRSCETITCAHPHLLRFHDNDHHLLTASKQLVWICITLELIPSELNRCILQTKILLDKACLTNARVRSHVAGLLRTSQPILLASS